MARGDLTNWSYDSDNFRHDLLVHGILPVIPSRNRNPLRQRRIVLYEFPQYRRRNALNQVFYQRDLAVNRRLFSVRFSDSNTRGAACDSHRAL